VYQVVEQDADVIELEPAREVDLGVNLEGDCGDAEEVRLADRSSSETSGP
jgi:hypothetical protein